MRKADKEHTLTITVRKSSLKALDNRCQSYGLRRCRLIQRDLQEYWCALQVGKERLMQCLKPADIKEIANVFADERKSLCSGDSAHWDGNRIANFIEIMGEQNERARTLTKKIRALDALATLALVELIHRG